MGSRGHEGEVTKEKNKKSPILKRWTSSREVRKIYGSKEKGKLVKGQTLTEPSKVEK